MKRSELRRRTPLIRTGGGLSRTKGLPATSTKGRQRRAAYEAARRVVLARDGCCVVCGTTQDLVVHHRRGRVSTADLLTPELLVTLCDFHHRHVHSHVAESYESGLMLRRVP